MKKISMLILVLLPVLATNVLAHSDQEVKDALRSSIRIDDSRYSKSIREYAFRLCGSDRDRFSRIAEDLATSEAWRPRSYIGMLGDYGSTNSIPFLESCCTNAELGFTAAMSILKLEGVTTNSLRAVAAFQAITNGSYEVRSDRARLLGSVVRWAMTPGLSVENKAMALAYAFDAATNQNLNVSTLEMEYKCWDPTYTHSKRRLRVLRSHALCPKTEFIRNYVTNAINELVAYPEADLPD